MAAIPSADYDTMASRFKSRPRVLALRLGIQHYAWGDSHFIPSLLGIVDAEDKPYAEVWMGAHPDLPSRACLDAMEIPLNELQKRRPLSNLYFDNEPVNAGPQSKHFLLL